MICLNNERAERINSALSNLRTFVEKDESIRKILLDFILQGSFAINTAIKPNNDVEEFDVDVVLGLDISQFPIDRQKPEDIIAWLANRLHENRPHYDGKVRQRKRCVRIVYAGDFHLDVVPAHCSGDISGPILVPNKEEDEWQLSHPKGYVSWASQVDEKSEGKFSRIMKMLKHWRDDKFGKDSAPNSILFTTLFGKHMSNGFSSDAEALVLTMENLSNYLNGISSIPSVSNPSLPTENLARNWMEDHFKLFRDRFTTATEKARNAYNDEDREKSIKGWQELFPAFPSSIAEDAKAIAEAIKTGGAFVTEAGRITVGNPNNEVATQILPHRSYGIRK